MSAIELDEIYPAGFSLIFIETIVASKSNPFQTYQQLDTTACIPPGFPN